MSLLFTAEQQELRSSFQKFLFQEFPSSYLRQRVEDKKCCDVGMWKKAVDFGITAVFADAGDAASPGIRELGFFAFESGKALCTEPLVYNAFCGPYLTRALLDDADRAGLAKLFGTGVCDSFDDGSTRVACALPTFAKPVHLKANREGPSTAVSGFIPGLASAQCSQFALCCAGDSLLLVKLDSTDEKHFQCDSLLDLAQRYQTYDAQSAPALELNRCRKSAIQHVQALVASELAGLASRAVDMTVDYVKTRKQFGVPVGGFQAVQHRLADMHVQSEAMRSLAEFAAWTLRDSPGQADIVSRAAITYATEYCAQIIEGAVQLHGGIGFTWEYDLHLYLRRAKLLEAWFAPKAAELEAFLDLVGNQG